jgi:hypothetical protein
MIMSIETLPMEAVQEPMADDTFGQETAEVPTRVFALGGSLTELVELDLDESSIDHLIKPVSTQAGSSGS